MENKQPRLCLKHITKSYSGNRVLNDVSMEVRPGEIHALLGENGAGKSTLMKILMGMDEIRQSGGFEGEVLLDGAPVRIDSPRQAHELGICMVHQELMLVSGFTVAENICVGREPVRRTGRKETDAPYLPIDFDAMAKQAGEALHRLNVELDTDTLVDELPVSQMQFVEIAREIDRPGIRLLILDEPTAVLNDAEAEHLLQRMIRLKESGLSILFISHRLDEVLRCCDRITVLRDGIVAGSMESDQTSVYAIAEMMMGKRPLAMEPTQRESAGWERSASILKLEGFWADLPGERVEGLDLEVRQGEILGLGGLSGQGKIGVANGLMGLCPSGGNVVLNGESLLGGYAGSVLRAGFGFVSEDRRRVGLLLGSSIEENIAIPAIHNYGRFLRRIGPAQMVDRKAVRENALAFIEALDIRCTGPDQPAGMLSGGNQQKVCVAQALTLRPRILLVSEPTRGIDIGAKQLLLNVLLRLNREQGITILFTSSELQELRSVCDRIAIVTRGRIAGILPPDAPEAEFGLLMSGMGGIRSGL